MPATGNSELIESRIQRIQIRVMAEGLEADISWRHERALKLKGTRWNKVIGSNHHPMTPIA
jgi:hypothetical protein